MSSPLKDHTNIDEIKERQKKLVTKARAEFEENNLPRSLKLLKKAYDLMPNEKLKRKVDRVEEILKEESGDLEGNSDTKEKSKPVGDCEVAPGLPMKKAIFDKLYSHQREGIAWLWKIHRQKKGGILADDMGLGKTVQIITFLNALYEAERIKRVLIVMPVSVMLTWDREFEAWGSKKFSVLHFHEDSKKQRLRNLRKIQRSSGVLLTTYGLLMTSFEEFSQREDGDDFEWDYFILDEGHKIKNKGNKTTKAAHAISSKHRIILTGTAIQNNLMELWSLFDFVHCGGLLGTQKSFKIHFEGPILRSRQRDASSGERHYGAEMAESLKKRIEPYFLRRTKAQVTEKKLNRGDKSTSEGKMPTLSRKNDFVVWLYLTEIQEKIYRDFLQLDVVKDLLVPSNKRSPLMELTILKKICDHPRLLSTFQCVQLGLENDDGMDMESEYAHQCAANRVEAVDNDVLMLEAGKVTFVANLIDELKKQGHRALIFSQSRKMLDIIEKVLRAADHRILRLDGTVTNLCRRQEIIEKFTQRPDRYSAFLLTTQVGGIGLTLTAADRVIIVDPSWNPATDNQAVDRAFRIGQDKNVVIYRLITCGTVEEKIYRRQIFKESITRQATGIHSNDRDPYRYFTSQQLRELFSLTCPRSSETQRQLQELHSAHRVTDEELDAHLAFLHSLDIFGLSDHDLMFSCEDDGPQEEVGELGASLARMTISTEHVAAMRARAEHQLNIESTMAPEDKVNRAQLNKYQAAYKTSSIDFRRGMSSANSTFIDFKRGMPSANSTFIEPQFLDSRRGPAGNSTFLDSKRHAMSAGSIAGSRAFRDSGMPEPRRFLPPPIFAPSHADTKRPMFNRVADPSTTWRQTQLEEVEQRKKTTVPDRPIVISSDEEEKVDVKSTSRSSNISTTDSETSKTNTKAPAGTSEMEKLTRNLQHLAVEEERKKSVDVSASSRNRDRSGNEDERIDVSGKFETSRDKGEKRKSKRESEGATSVNASLETSRDKEEKRKSKRESEGATSVNASLETSRDKEGKRKFKRESEGSTSVNASLETSRDKEGKRKSKRESEGATSVNASLETSRDKEGKRKFKRESEGSTSVNASLETSRDKEEKRKSKRESEGATSVNASLETSRDKGEKRKSKRESEGSTSVNASLETSRDKEGKRKFKRESEGATSVNASLETSRDKEGKRKFKRESEGSTSVNASLETSRDKEGKRKSKGKSEGATAVNASLETSRDKEEKRKFKRESEGSTSVNASLETSRDKEEKRKSKGKSEGATAVNASLEASRDRGDSRVSEASELSECHRISESDRSQRNTEKNGKEENDIDDDFEPGSEDRSEEKEDAGQTIEDGSYSSSRSVTSSNVSIVENVQEAVEDEMGDKWTTTRETIFREDSSDDSDSDLSRTRESVRSQVSRSATREEEEASDTDEEESESDAEEQVYAAAKKGSTRFRRLIVEDSDESDPEDTRTNRYSESSAQQDESSALSSHSVQRWEIEELGDDDVEDRIRKPDIVKILSRSLASSPNTPVRRPVLVENSFDDSGAGEMSSRLEVSSDSMGNISHVEDSLEDA